MPQQHDLENPRHEPTSTGHAYDGLDANVAAPAPRPTPPRTAHRPTLADLAGLTHLLVAPIPAARAIAAAVERATQLIPAARQLTLYALDPAAPGRLIRLVSARREQPRASPQLDAQPVATDTLGHGERADRQVLAERSIARPTGAALLPLVVSGALLGVLEVASAPDAARPDPALLDLLADLLGALLERRAASEELHRTTQALEVLPALAFAPERDETAVREPAPAAEEDVTALLRAGSRALRAIAATHNCIALVRMPNGVWSALPGAPLPGDIGITPDQAAALLPALRAGPLTISPGQESMLWSELAPLRQQGGYPNARVHLIAAASPRTTFAIYAVAEGPATPPAPRWLPMARALATIVAAGIAARGLAGAARDEAQARDAYVSLVAHELRSPMTAIKGYAQLLVRQSHRQPLPDPVIRSVEAIEQQSQRLAEMLGELLDASRLRRGTLPPAPAPVLVDLGATARGVVERRQAMYPQHTITLDLSPEPLTAAGEEARIEQVLRDLIDNAARHSPSDSVITVGVSRTPGGEALIAVRDTGIGIAAEDRGRIFEYLYRAPRSMERNLAGLGLGLYASQHLVERMGGRLWLEASSTEPPTGSEFRFTLPLA